MRNWRGIRRPVKPSFRTGGSAPQGEGRRRSSIGFCPPGSGEGSRAFRADFVPSNLPIEIDPEPFRPQAEFDTTNSTSPLPFHPIMKRRHLLAAGAAGLSVAAATQNAQAADNPDLAKIQELLGSHDEAMTAHDLDGVLGTFADDAMVMGTGPGEMWAGKEELKEAYGHFFEVFDKGAQDFEYSYRQGDLSAEMGWLMASGTVKGTKDGKDFAYPLNVSLTVSKSGSDWKIAAMHFSTLVGSENA